MAFFPTELHIVIAIIYDSSGISFSIRVRTILRSVSLGNLVLSPVFNVALMSKHITSVAKECCLSSKFLSIKVSRLSKLLYAALQNNNMK